MGLSELTEFAEDNWEYRVMAINIIQSLLEDPDGVIRILAANSLKNLRGEGELIQVEELTEQSKTKVPKSLKRRVKRKDSNGFKGRVPRRDSDNPEGRVTRKDYDEVVTKIHSYEGKVRLIELSAIISFIVGMAFTYIPGGSILAIVMLVVFILAIGYYIFIRRQLKKLVE